MIPPGGSPLIGRGRLRVAAAAADRSMLASKTDIDPRRVRGFSVPEILVVMSVITIAVMVAIPIVAEQVRSVKARAAVYRFVGSMREARMLAVTRHVDVPVSVEVAVVDAGTGRVTAGNRYMFSDAFGDLRQMELPREARVASTDTTITFRPNGAVVAVARTVIESGPVAEPVESWIVDTNVMGVTTVTHQRHE